MAEAKILVVDDEKNIVEAVKYSLTKAGFRVVTAADGQAGINRCRSERPDLVVLDIMLPKIDGFEVCRALRQDANTRSIPIIMLSVKSAETDKVVGLELGADDYLTKPFSPRELVARVKAVLRRHTDVAKQMFEVDQLRVDWERHTVTLKGRPVALTSKELRLLKALINAHGRVLSRDALLDRVWGYEQSLEITTRTVDLHVSQLRKKLGKAGERILTVRNAGYRFVTDEASPYYPS